METAIKVCGISTPDALDAAVRARVDHVGFVFFDKSPRNVTLADARALAQRAGGRMPRVGLFVDADDSAIGDAIAAAGLSALQFHGSETPQRVAEARARFGLPVWKAIAVKTRDDVKGAARYDGAADLILFDAKTPKGALPGGMGQRFDWSLLSGHRSGTPWGLAGGLSPDNVAAALTATQAPLVDVSSGVESTPGVKDVAKIAAFCEAVRHHDSR